MTKNDDSGDWSQQLVRRIGAAMRTARGSRSAKWLSDRTDELGYRVSPTVIAKLDSGHRGDVLSVAELLVIAAALDVPPVALLFSDLPDGEVEVLPGQFVSSIAALLRFTGELDRDPSTDLGRLAKLSRDQFEKRVKRDAANALVEKLAAKAQSDSEIEGAAAMILEVIDKADEVREVNRQIAAIPGSVVAQEGTGS